MKITADMKVCEVLSLSDEMELIFEKHGLLCTGCPGAVQETLAEAAEGHGLAVEILLEDLNRQEDREI